MPDLTHTHAPLEKLSPGEERFERYRRSAGFWLAPLAFLAVLLLPLGMLTPKGHTLAAIITLVSVLWLTEAIPLAIAALLGPVLCVLLGVAPTREVLGCFGDPIILLFLGTFILAQAMMEHGVSRRFALMILSRQWIAKSPSRVIFAFGGVTAFLSMWISNTATTAMMVPIGLGILSALRAEGGMSAGRFGTGLMLVAAYASTLGGIATPVGSPPNLISIGALAKLTGHRISFFEWTVMALPVAVVLCAVLFFYIARTCAPRGSGFGASAAFIKEERRKLGPMSRGEINTMAAFLVTVSLWVGPGFVALLWGGDSAPAKWCTLHLPESVAALTGAILLFVLPVDWKKREFTITLKKAFEIDWGTLILFGGGLALGDQMFRTGLADALGKTLVVLTGAHTLPAITALAVGFTILMTEGTSNTAAANMAVPVVIAIAQAAGVDPLPPALGAGLGASMGFLMPVSTPPNAIIYGTGLVPLTRMVAYGFLLSVTSFVVITFAALYLLPRIF
ncbi:MAG: SLC13 family permease [Verrucomicrobiia bacterium]